jgi:tetratricopeptide (TPR) repeat protein
MIFDQYPDLWPFRDDLYVEYVSLLNLLGDSSQAYVLIMKHKFHPWEGGEGKVIAHYVLALKQMAIALVADEPAQAKLLLLQALQVPDTLGEGKLEGAKDNDIHYLLGLCAQALGNRAEAEEEFELATVKNGDPAGMMYYNDQPADMILYEGLALRKLGRINESMARFHKLVDYGEKHYFDKITIDYFAVSLPELQLFDVDLTPRNRIHCEYLIALGNIGLGDCNLVEKTLAEILRKDCNHCGAAFHARIYRELM